MAARWYQRFNEAIFTRLGEAYQKKVVRTVDLNDIRICSKHVPNHGYVHEAATEDILPRMKEFMSLNCFDWERCDYKNCAIYAMAMDIVGWTDEGCPYGVGI